MCGGVSAAASGRSCTAKPGDPAANDIGGAAAAVIWIYIDGVRRAVFGAGAALHAGVRIDKQGHFAFNLEDTVGTDQFAVTATDAFLL